MTSFVESRSNISISQSYSFSTLFFVVFFLSFRINEIMIVEDN